MHFVGHLQRYYKNAQSSYQQASLQFMYATGYLKMASLVKNLKPKTPIPINLNRKNYGWYLSLTPSQ
jgi:hypothetical protein